MPLMKQNIKEGEELCSHRLTGQDFKLSIWRYGFNPRWEYIMDKVVVKIGDKMYWIRPVINVWEEDITYEFIELETVGVV